MALDVQTERLREQLTAALAGWGETGEAVLDSGLSYGDGEPVRVRIRKRDRRYVVDDDGGAARKAEVSLRRRDRYERADRLAGEEGLNVTRDGVVFVPAVEGRDLAQLAIKVADTSRALYAELLELSD